MKLTFSISDRATTLQTVQIEVKNAEWLRVHDFAEKALDVAINPAQGIDPAGVSDATCPLNIDACIGHENVLLADRWIDAAIGQMHPDHPDLAFRAAARIADTLRDRFGGEQD